MVRSDYMYTLDLEKGFIEIVDLNQGGMSEKEGIDTVTMDVVYRDSEGIWDGYDPILHEFIILNASTLDEAKSLYDIKLA